MKSSTTSSWESTTSQKLLGVPERTEEEDLITNSNKELVEFYWSNRKRFSGCYAGFPVKVL